MRGVGTATAALTIVNALPTGIGCALGLGLSATAEVDLRSSDPSVSPGFRIAPANRTPLVETAARLAFSRFFPRPPDSADLTVRSEIPLARGLKSSSAVASAIVLAVARAAGVEIPVLEVARLSAEIGRASGVSATGAFDDALAGLQPGFCLTDNRGGKLLGTGQANAGWGAAVLVPPGAHGPSPRWTAEFAREVGAATQAVDLVRRGDFWGAMELNSALVERVMGYDYASLRGELRAEGALGAGVSGLGPAFVAVAPWERLPRLLDLLARRPGERLRVPISPSRAVAPETSR